MDVPHAAYLVTGFASERSIAAAITRQLIDDHCDVFLVVAGEREAKRAAAFRAACSHPERIQAILELDVSAEENFAAFTATMSELSPRLTGVVHAIGRAALTQDQAPLQVHEASAAAWQESLLVSSWSLPKLINTVMPWLEAGASVVTLTYHGAHKAVPGYNVMGVAKAALESAVRYLALELGPQQIRVNGISAGSIRTPAAQAVPGFGDRLAKAAANSPLGRTVSAAEVAATAAFLLSPQASGITGQIITCDAGVGIVG